MPNVAKFDVQPAVEEWMARRDLDRIEKFMHQEYVTSFTGTDTKKPNTF